MDFCQSRAVTSERKPTVPGPSIKSQTSSGTGNDALRFSNLLNEAQLSESDLSLLPWLRSIPASTFGCPFQRRNLRVDVEPLPPMAPKMLLNVSIIDSASDLLSR